MGAEPDCIFCQIVAGDLPATVVDSDERTVSFMDINPATRGHALVIPREHYRDLHKIREDDLAAVMSVGKMLASRVVERLGADGINLHQSNGEAAWQTVFHFHLHVIPRYEDDPLRLPWRPSPGDPDAIRDAARALGAG